MLLISNVLVLLVMSYVASYDLGTRTTRKLRICVIQERGRYKKAAQFCPILDHVNSDIECVVASDSMDCLRRMSKGTVDFGVFQPEVLMAAQWANLDILVTNQIAFTNHKYEEEIVSLISKKLVRSFYDGTGDYVSSGARAVLRDTVLCHPWSGDDKEDDFSYVIQQYLESIVTEHSCSPELTLLENRIRDTSMYFQSACKAGVWHPDKIQDRILKLKYPNLCGGCAQRSCFRDDRYWGPKGATYCLDDSAGDALWARRTDIESYFFQRRPEAGGSSADDWMYLCTDGKVMEIRNTTVPCVWLAKPWPAVVSKRKSAVEVQKMMNNLNRSNVESWQSAIIALIGATPRRGGLLVTAGDYLTGAEGFTAAYSQAGCQPPRHIRMCVSSILEQNKCWWLAESSSVFGVQPGLECLLRESQTSCLTAVSTGEADVTISRPDFLVKAYRDYNLAPILYEAVKSIDNSNTVAVYTTIDTNIKKWSQMIGYSVYLPVYDSFAWHGMISTWFPSCTSNPIITLANNLGPSCIPGLPATELPSYVISKLTALCSKDQFIDTTPLKYLAEGKVQFAVMAVKTAQRYLDGVPIEDWIYKLKNKTKLLCRDANTKKEECFLSWSYLGYVLARENVTELKKKEIEDMFKRIDVLFGKNQPFHVPIFKIFNQFSDKSDIIFSDDAYSLITIDESNMFPYSKSIDNFESSLKEYVLDSIKCTSVATINVLSFSMLLVIFMLSFLSW